MVLQEDQRKNDTGIRNFIEEQSQDFFSERWILFRCALPTPVKNTKQDL